MSGAPACYHGASSTRSVTHHSLLITHFLGDDLLGRFSLRQIAALVSPLGIRFVLPNDEAADRFRTVDRVEHCRKRSRLVARRRLAGSVFTPRLDPRRGR